MRLTNSTHVPDYTVNIVDPDQSMLKALSRLLKIAGFEAATFRSIEDFLKAGKTNRPCCLVIDVVQPATECAGILENIVATRQDLKIIYISEHDDVHLQEQAIKAGASAYLVKPFDDRFFLDAVQTALEQHDEVYKGEVI